MFMNCSLEGWLHCVLFELWVAHTQRYLNNNFLAVLQYQNQSFCVESSPEKYAFIEITKTSIFSLGVSLICLPDHKV